MKTITIQILTNKLLTKINRFNKFKNKENNKALFHLKTKKNNNIKNKWKIIQTSKTT